MSKLPTLENLQRRIDKIEAETIESKGDADNTYSSGTAETANIAWNVVSGATVGILGGYGLDFWLHTSPIFLIAGFFLGFAGGVYALVRKSQASDTNTKNDTV